MITSTSNAQVKALSKLIKNARARRQQQVYIVEGIRMFRETPEDRIEKIYASESFVKEHETLLAGKDWEMLSDSVFASVSDTKTPQGVLCLVKMRENRLEDMLQQKNGLWLILENVQDPGNLGTILRTAEGAGVDGVILSKESVDIYNPKTIRSTMGSVYRLPFLYVDSIEAILPVLKKHHVHTYAAHLKGKNSYEQENYCGGTAFFIGNEGNGLTDHLSSQADTLIRIPMEGKLESLNAAVASAILMYESYRQRRNA